MFVQDGARHGYPRPQRRRGWGRILVLATALVLATGRLAYGSGPQASDRVAVAPGRCEGHETLDGALGRELKEALRLDARVGPLVMVCESVAPDRDVINLIFQAEIGEGAAPVLDPRDPVLAGWQWVTVDQLPRLDFRPPIAEAVQAVIAENFAGPVHVLGDTWKPESR